jgi:hypothetical protein
MARRDDDLWGWVVFVVLAGALVYLALVILAHGRARGDALQVGDAFTGKGVKDVSGRAAICVAALALSCGGGVDGAGLAPGRTPMLVPGVDSGSLVLLDGAGADAARAAEVAADLALIDSALAAADVAPIVVPDAAPQLDALERYPFCRSLGEPITNSEPCPEFMYTGQFTPRCTKCTAAGAPVSRACRMDERDWFICVASCAACPAEFRDGGAP